MSPRFHAVLFCSFLYRDHACWLGRPMDPLYTRGPPNQEENNGFNIKKTCFCSGKPGFWIVCGAAWYGLLVSVVCFDALTPKNEVPTSRRRSFHAFRRRGGTNTRKPLPTKRRKRSGFAKPSVVKSLAPSSEASLPGDEKPSLNRAFEPMLEPTELSSSSAPCAYRGSLT